MWQLVVFFVNLYHLAKSAKTEESFFLLPIVISASGIFFGFTRRAADCFRLEYGGRSAFKGRNNMKEFGACG